ncbi:MAG TPA: hypothetical protein VGH87_04030 [Polyangiaceae bacterium]
MRAIAVGVGVALALVVTFFGACTVFDGLDGKVVTDGGSDAIVPNDANLLQGEQPGYLSVSDGVAFCSNVFACPNLATSVEWSIDVPVDTNHFSSCVDWVSGPLPKDRNGHDITAPILQCIAKATSCNAAGACLWQEVIDVGDPRCAGKDAGKLGSCGDDGGSIYFCGASPGLVHCNNAFFTAGSSCMYDDAGAPWCTTLPCGAQQCLGDMLTYCGTDGLQFSQNCAMGGFTCGLDAKEGYDDCLTNGSRKVCNSLAISCSGNTVEICDGYFVSDFDCATYGGTCDQTAFPRCKRPNESCTALDGDVDVCAGNALTLCVNGEKTSFDCTTLGKTCAGASGGQSGHCQ